VCNIHTQNGTENLHELINVESLIDVETIVDKMKEGASECTCKLKLGFNIMNDHYDGVLLWELEADSIKTLFL
jgi:hypothetical protein